MISILYLYYLGVIVLCSQKKCSFPILAFNNSSSVSMCVYKHGSLFQQNFKAFYLPIFSSRQKRSIGMNIFSLYISTTAAG